MNAVVEVVLVDEGEWRECAGLVLLSGDLEPRKHCSQRLLRGIPGDTESVSETERFVKSLNVSFITIY